MYIKELVEAPVCESDSGILAIPYTYQLNWLQSDIEMTKKLAGKINFPKVVVLSYK